MRGFAGAAVLTAALGACGDGGSDSPPEPPPPPGAVFTVDGEPVRADDVDAYAAACELVVPEASLDHRRRIALSDTYLRRALLAARFPAEREGALRDARAELELRRTEAATGPPPPDQVFTGNVPTVGYHAWLAARDLAPGAWSEPYETVGEFVLVQLLSHEPGPRPVQDEWTVRILRFPYVPPDTTAMDVEAWADASRLVVVAPEWEDALPPDWKYRIAR